MNFELIKQRHRVYLMTAVLVTALAVFMNEANTVVRVDPSATSMGPSNDQALGDANILALPADESLVTDGVTDLVSSLSGTHHGVSLKSNNQGLIITASLKDLFDYYLSAAGEESTNRIDQRIKAELSRQLQAEALAQAMAIWRDYFAYKNSLVAFDQQYSANANQLDKLRNLQLLQQRQFALIALQDQMFGAKVAEILFKFDRQFDGYTLEKAELLASDLSAEQIQQRLINLSAQLPLDTILSTKRNEQQRMLVEIGQKEGLSAQQKYHQRVLQVGTAAASRLQVLDEKRSAWKQKITDFKKQKQQLEQVKLAREDYKINLDKLYSQHFAPEEQLRARALIANGE